VEIRRIPKLDPSRPRSEVPRKFTREQLKELKEMYESVAHSLMYYL
jgi:hypothetical protein